MLERFLLKLSHHEVALINCRCHFRAVPVLCSDRFSKTGIGRSHLKLKRLAPNSEPGLDRINLDLLLRRQFKVAMKQGMKFGLACTRPIGNKASDEDTANRRCERHQGEQ